MNFRIAKGIFGLTLLAVWGIAASGPGGGNGTPQVSLHIPNETAPPGGVAQMKFLVTEPTPISTGGPKVSFDSAIFDDVWGIELFCPAGEASGIATVRGSQISLHYITTAGAQGNDYPIMTMALHVRPDALPGSSTQFQLSPTSTWTLGLLGATTLKPTPPAIVTVGGSISIHNVVPGGGLLPAGTVVSILGMGFQPKTHVQLNAIKFSSIRVVSPSEIQFTLAEATNMTGQKIQVVNPDNSQDTYFSYLRGQPLAASSFAGLAGAAPIFSPAKHSWTVYAAMGSTTPSLFSGIAVQNPNLASADVTVWLYSAQNALLGSSTVTLPSGYKLMKETSEWAQGAHAPFGSYVVVRSSAPVQVLGLAGDQTTGEIYPLTAALSQ